MFFQDYELEKSRLLQMAMIGDMALLAESTAEPTSSQSSSKTL